MTIFKKSKSRPALKIYVSRFVNIQGADETEPGGIFTMGYLNTSLYTGNIEYTALANSGSYWLIPMTRQLITIPSLRPNILILTMI